MALFVSTTSQAVALNAPVVLQSNEIKCCAIKHKAGSGFITLGSCGRYRVSVNLKVTGVAGAIGFGVYQDGESVPWMNLSVVPAATTDSWTTSCTGEFATSEAGSKISIRALTAGATVETASVEVEKVG